MSESKSAPKVAVTGATGYLAGVLITQLIAKGYHVHATIRPGTRNAEKAIDLQLHFTLEKLTLFEAGLTDKDDSNFRKCFDGCQFVFHTASPFLFLWNDAKKDLVDPAVIGTRNVVSAAIATDSVKKIILTSALAAIIGVKDPEHVFDESDNCAEASLADAPFPFAKLQAEKTAIEILKESGTNRKLAIINPAFMIGSPATRTSNSMSLQTIGALMTGKFQNGARPVSYAVVSVSDVAAAHIAAAEREDAEGRFIVSSDKSFTMLEIASTLKRYFPFCSLPTTTIDAEKLPAPVSINNTRATKELGLKLSPVDDTLRQMGMTFIKAGALSDLNLKAGPRQGSSSLFGSQTARI